MSTDDKNATMDTGARMYALAPRKLCPVACSPIDGQWWHCGNCFTGMVSRETNNCSLCHAEVWIEPGMKEEQAGDDDGTTR